MSSKGVVFLAIGHPHYVSMAGNCAAGVKINNPDIKITLITEESVINTVDASYKNQFDNIVYINSKYYNIGNKNHWGRAKLSLYNIVTQSTDLDEALFIDADSLLGINCNIDNIFNTIAPYDFWISNYETLPIAAGTGNIGHWADLSAFINTIEFKSEVIPTSIQSSLIYFKRNETIKQYFDDALEIHDNIVNGGITYNNRWFGAVPDELCFSLSYAKNDLPLHPHNSILYSIYRSVKPSEYSDLVNSAHIITFSTGTNTISMTALQLYNNLTAYYARKRGIRFIWQWKDKVAFNKLNIIRRS